MSDLTDFLLARIAEDEEAATGLRDQYPHSGGPGHLSGNWDIVQVTTGYDRVLAECEAKREIVEMSQLDGLAMYERVQVEADPVDAEDFAGGAEWALAHALRCLASAYADHPDYREEWRP